MSKQNREKLLIWLLAAAVVIPAMFEFPIAPLYPVQFTALRILCVWGVLFFVILWYRHRYLAIIAAEDSRYKALLDNLDGGLISCRFDPAANGLKVEYASDGWAAITGYTAKDVIRMFDGNPNAIIHPSDRERTLASYLEQTATSTNYRLQYRIQRRDGQVLWVADHGYVIKDVGDNTINQSILTDINSLKESENDLRISKEMLKSAICASNEAVFGFEISTNSFTRSENTEQVLGYTSQQITEDTAVLCSAHGKNFVGGLSRLFFHCDEAATVMSAYSTLTETGNPVTFEARMKKSDGSYIWCRIHLVIVVGDDDSLSHIVGHIADIDEEYTQRKQLHHQASCDPFTGLNNRVSARSIINDCLSQHPDSLHALLLIDIDNFKHVNDTRGHLNGDHVLTVFTSVLRDNSLDSEVLGRIGGDEFICFMPHLSSPNDAICRAQQLCGSFAQRFADDCGTTCSVGVSLSSAGDNFEAMFLQADMALYQSKENGKNRASLFGEQL